MSSQPEGSHRGFDGIIGHDVPVRVLSHLVETGKLPGTLLFSGPGGVGKLATALSLAKFLHCKESCDPLCECSECSAIRMGNHPDVIVVSRDRDLSVEEMRAIVSMGQLKTSASGERVIILDRAERITTQAANAALKMLEEPGERTRFILITDTPAKLLSTVRSRSYKLRFSLLAQDEMEKFAKSVGADMSDKDVRDGIKFSSGRGGLFLRWHMSEEFRNVSGMITDWLSGITDPGYEPSVERMVEWKLEWRGREGKKKIKGYMNRLYDVERTTGIPRGGDVHEIREFIKSDGKYAINPLNWQFEPKGGKPKKRLWSDSRKSLHLAKLMTRILSVENGESKTGAILSVQDFIRKINWNCSFDIALERLYFSLAGN